tara:strand:+ start:89 stop:484 length:396 start_codon:yes stop_codon:yes gene_type:complete
MANNRELSQLGSIVNIDDSNKSLGIGASVGIGTTVPHYQLDVNGDVNFSGDLYQDGNLFTSGLGVGVGTITPTSGIITGRVGVGFTDMNFIGTGITVTGYGSTVVVDMSSIAAASAGASGDDAIVFAIAFG